MRITKQGHLQRRHFRRRHAKLRQKSRRGRRVRLKLPALLVQCRFVQQAAGLVGEAGEEKMFRQRQARMRRRQGMATFHPFLGAQAFQVEPYRARIALRHGGNVAGRDIAGEKFDHDIGDVAGRKYAFLIAPVAHRHAGELLHFGVDRHLRANAPEAAQIVYPQGDGDAMLLLQLPCQAPADTDVAVVIDDFAEYGQGGCLALIEEHGGRFKLALGDSGPTGIRPQPALRPRSGTSAGAPHGRRSAT